MLHTTFRKAHEAGACSKSYKKEETRCREYRENAIGRYHSYKCRACGRKFRIFLFDALPEKARLCSVCLKSPELKTQFDRAFDKRKTRLYENAKGGKEWS